MKKHLALLGVLALSGPVLTSCNSSDNANTIVQPAVDPMTADASDLSNRESNLLSVGIRFAREGQNDVIDQGYLDSFLQENRNVSRGDIIDSLQDYIDDGQRIMDKWGDELPHRREIEAKNRAAEEEASALEQENNGGPHNHHE